MGTYIRLGTGAKFAEGLRIKQLSRESYSLFLVHFPMCMLANAIYARLADNMSELWGWIFMGLAWWASMTSAKYFYLWVDQRSEQILQRLTALPKAVSWHHWRFWADV
jgi:peptidoglycan/LPS O-acetylase OafA/YrhL